MDCSKKYDANLGIARCRRWVGRLTVGVQLSVDEGVALCWQRVRGVDRRRELASPPLGANLPLGCCATARL